MIIVKLGGSLYNSPELTLWLQTLADISQSTSIVIVPGGGPFADQVRIAQQHHHFDDNTAHHMALTAMKQFGLMLCGLEEKCQPFNYQQSISPLSVWLPDDMLLSETELPHSWDITSDSIALWLAAKLKADHLFLVKHVMVNTISTQQLAVEEVIDQGFVDLFAKYTIPTQIIHYQAYSDFAKAFMNQNIKTNMYLS